jgi:hypothetical protein
MVGFSGGTLWAIGAAPAATGGEVGGSLRRTGLCGGRGRQTLKRCTYRVIRWGRVNRGRYVFNGTENEKL